MLTGNKKKIYQRNYMREYMRNKRKKQVVKTLQLRPKTDADGNVMYDV